MFVTGQGLGQAAHDQQRCVPAVVHQVANHIEQLPVSTAQGIGADLRLAQAAADRCLGRLQARIGQRRHHIALCRLRQ